jgi:hypothetical protein
VAAASAHVQANLASKNAAMVAAKKRGMLVRTEACGESISPN